MNNRRAAREDQPLQTATRLLKERGYRNVSNLPPAEKLRWALFSHAVAMMDHLDLVTVDLQERRCLPQPDLEQALSARKHYEWVLMQILEDGISFGQFRPVEVKMAVFGLLDMLCWTYPWFAPEGESTSEEIAATLSDLALYGLFAGEG